MSTPVIVDAIRTPIGSFAGILAPVRADDLAAHVLRALLERHPKLDPAAIEDVANDFAGIHVSAAVGMPDQYAGEVPVLFVVPAHPAPRPC